MSGALAGLQILEFSEGWSGGAWTGRLLADLGAEVIKIEPAGGDPLRDEPGSERFAVIHAGKRFRRLPAEPGAGGDLPAWLRQAIDAADIIVDGYPPRARPTWRPAVEAAAAGRPDLILAQVSVHGRTGPLADLPGSELTSQARAGTIDSTGYPDAPPARVGVAVGEHGAALYATTGILAALWERASSGLGQTLDVASHDCLISYLGTFLPAYFHAGERPTRIGNRHTTLSPWNVYPTRDGWLIICSGTDAQWRQIADLIGRPELAADPRLAEGANRVQHVEIVDAAIAEWTHGRGAAEVVAACDAIGVPNGPILTVGDLLANEHFRHREVVRSLPGGGLSAGRLFKLGDVPRASLGANTEGESGQAPLGWTRRPIDARSARPVDRPAEPPLAGPPLAGLRILELASYTAGPYCGRILAALGADVIKVEPPAGDGVRRFGHRVNGDGYFFHINNAGVRSVRIDTRLAEGRSTLLDLVRQSDAFFENFAAGTLAKQGLGPADLLAVNPSLVYASVNGFGLSGPLRDRRAYDTVIQGLGGILHLTGPTDRPPVKAGISVADVIGATGAAAAILAALYHRRRTGRGGLVDVSMHDLAGWLTAEYGPLAARAATAAYRPGNEHPYLAPHGLYAAADGLLAIAVAGAAEWDALRSVVTGLPADPALRDTAARIAQRAALDETIQTWTGERSQQAALADLLAAGVPAAPVLNPAEAIDGEAARDRALAVTVKAANGEPVRQIGLPIRFSRTPAGVSTTAPLLGNADRAVLHDLLDASVEPPTPVSRATHSC